MNEITEGPLLVVEEGQTARLIFNRPEKKNAIDMDTLHRLNASIREALADDRIRSIVLAGMGGFFSSGRDISEIGGSGAKGNPMDNQKGPFLETFHLLLESHKPTIAAVKGFALGGGQAISLACDFVVAERGAKFGNVEMSYGFPAAMNLVLLQWHLGRRLGLEIALTGKLYTAERYYEIGLVNRLAEEGGLEQETDEFVKVFNSLEPWAVHRTKDAFYRSEETTLKSGLYIGDQLNQLLGAARGRQVHSQSGEVKHNISNAIRETD